MRLLLLYRLWKCKAVARFKLAAFFYALKVARTLLRGSEARHQIA